MASKIKVDQIEGSTASTITLPSGQTLDLSSGSLTLPDSAVDLSTAKVTGTIPVAKGGTGLTSLGTANQVLAVNSGASALEFQNVSSDYEKITETEITSAVAQVDFNNTVLTSTYKSFWLIDWPLLSPSVPRYLKYLRPSPTYHQQNQRTLQRMKPPMKQLK